MTRRELFLSRKNEKARLSTGFELSPDRKRGLLKLALRFLRLEIVDESAAVHIHLVEALQDGVQRGLLDLLGPDQRVHQILELADLIVAVLIDLAERVLVGEPLVEHLRERHPRLLRRIDLRDGADHVCERDGRERSPQGDEAAADRRLDDDVAKSHGGHGDDDEVHGQHQRGALVQHHPCGADGRQHDARPNGDDDVRLLLLRHAPPGDVVLRGLLHHLDDGVLLLLKHALDDLPEHLRQHEHEK
mmetsp:Transcript_14237/g.36340  ORF Transcript_14237/g.36340 Transcript_14237/m.36340 type:complete len:246 (+) Transcript_14237:1385-2122(+)